LRRGNVPFGARVEVDPPSVVGTSTTTFATVHPFQRKSFYANGRFWAFYSDGTNIVYSTSTDGSTWSSATTVRAATVGYLFSVWFDGTYLHYAYANYSPIYYRRGTPNSDGTITWSAVEQTVSTTYNKPFYLMVSVDSNGYVWIGYMEYDGTYYYPYVIKSGNNDGTWGTTPSGFPYQLSTTASTYWKVSIVPLTAGKMLALYTVDSGNIWAKRWDGSVWGVEVATASAIRWSQYHSAVAQGDDVHLTFLKNAGYDILYVKYVYASNSFGTETTLQAGATADSAPVLSIDTATNDLYVFAATKTTGTPVGWTANHIYYVKYTASSSTWGSWTDWIDETAEVLTDADGLTCFYQSYGSKIGLEYMTGTASPYNVKFAFLSFVTSTSGYAVAYPFQRKTFYANGCFWVFYSDGTNMVYSTSTDGSTWTVGGSSPIRACTGGYMFSVWFDGTYLHYAYVYASSIYYRRGTPNSDGSITWSTSTEQTVSTNYNTAYFPMVSVDSNGYVWIGYMEYDGTYYYPYVIKSGNNDGTWGTTPSGFPYQLSTTTNVYWKDSIVPLTAGKMLAIYAYSGGTVKAKSWNGTAWGTEVATTSAICNGYCHSAVAQGDDVHLTFLKSTYDILYVKYTYASNSFGTETTLQATATSNSAPVLSIDTATNDLYVFYATKTTGSPAGSTANHVYYMKYTAASSTWGSAVDWLNETAEVLTQAYLLTCFYQSYGSKIGLEYMTGTASPYNVKFAFLSLVVAAPPKMVGDGLTWIIS